MKTQLTIIYKSPFTISKKVVSLSSTDETQMTIRSVIETVEATYGNLGFLSFRLHSLRPNHKDQVYVIRYSFVPREKEAKRIFYEGRVNIQTKNLNEIKEIKESDLSKDDN
jgi:hypothetical protein